MSLKWDHENLKPWGLQCNFGCCNYNPALTSEMPVLVMVPRGGGWWWCWGGCGRSVVGKWGSAAFLICMKSSVHARMHRNVAAQCRESDKWIFPNRLAAMNPVCNEKRWCRYDQHFRLEQARSCCRLQAGRRRAGRISAGMCGHRSGFRGLSPDLRFNLVSGLARKGVGTQTVKLDLRGFGLRALGLLLVKLRRSSCVCWESERQRGESERRRGSETGAVGRGWWLGGGQ